MEKIRQIKKRKKKKENEMNIEKENLKNNEEMEELVKENEALKKRIQELHENLEDISGKTEITEENILSSKHFQSLIAQAENILIKLEKLKEINNNLQKENNSLNQKKENEILQISNSFNEQLEKSSQKLLEMAKTIEKNKTTIQLLMNKIESNENLLKEKDSFNLNIFYDSFKKERENLIQKIDFLETQKKDYINKYEDECLKNQTNQLNISILRNEINNLKIIMNSNKNEDKKMLQYDLNKEAIKNEQEKVEIYKKDIDRLKNEILKERKNSQGLTELNEMSQKNITELNTTIKNLKNKIDELNQNFSKVLNEKTESKQTISFLTEMKEVLEKKNEVFKEQLDNYSIYTKKMEDELEMQKKLNNSLEEAKKLNEKDIEILKSKNIENLKNIDKEKMMKDDLQNKFNELKNNKKKMAIDYDVLKTKYDDLCKAKQFDPNSIDVENINKENEVLKLENQKFREMVHCKVCKTEIKNVVITKCFHTFCKKCIDAAIESRKRRCPICRELISQNDVKKIFWD
jgi:E3 ubiquitin-protein ligase BRE1